MSSSVCSSAYSSDSDEETAMCKKKIKREIHEDEDEDQESGEENEEIEEVDLVNSNEDDEDQQQEGTGITDDGGNENTTNGDDDDDGTVSEIDFEAFSQISRRSNARTTTPTVRPASKVGNANIRIMDLKELRSGDLALVWTVGNMEISSISSNTMKQRIHEADLEEFCDYVKIVCEGITAQSVVRQRLNIKLIHAGIILKGLAIMLNMQLSVCKRHVDVDFELLRSPAEIGLAENIKKVAKKPKVHNSRQREGTPDLDAGVGFGALNIEITPSRSVSPRMAVGNFEVVPPAEDVHVVDSGEKRKKRGKNGGKKNKRKERIHEKDIMALLENHASALEQNMNDFIIPGSRNDLPDVPIGGNNFDNSELGDFPTDGLMRDNEPIQREQEHSPSPQNRRRKGGQVVPEAPRKRHRMDSPNSEKDLNESMLLETLESEVGQGDRKKRKLVFSKKTTKSLRELLKAQSGGPTSQDLRKLAMDGRVKYPSISGITFLGLEFIENSGRIINSYRLKRIIKANKPSQHKIAKHKHIVVDANGQDSTDVTNLDQEIAGVANDARVEEIHYMEPGPGPTEQPRKPNEDIPSAVETSFMAPTQADPICTPSPVPPGFAIPDSPVDAPAPAPLSRPKKDFIEIIGANPSRHRVCQAFALLLKMQGRMKVSLTQDSPYGPILVEQLVK